MQTLPHVLWQAELRTTTSKANPNDTLHTCFQVANMVEQDTRVAKKAHDKRRGSDPDISLSLR